MSHKLAVLCNAEAKLQLGKVVNSQSVPSKREHFAEVLHLFQLRTPKAFITLLQMASAIGSCKRAIAKSRPLPAALKQ